MNLEKMKRIETYKYYVKTKLDLENDSYQTKVKVKGDYFETLMFALEEVVIALIKDVGMNKKDFLKSMGQTYDIIKEGEKENGK